MTRPIKTDRYALDYGYRPKLRRNKADSILGGVCAGLGDWLGIDHGPMRILFVLAIIFTGLPALVYVLMWIFIPSDKGASRIHSAPAPTGQASGVRTKFRSLEKRLQDLEASVTSTEWKLSRDFRDLES